ncbi:MAG TPA: Maf family protein [Devosiaceae bacterium]|jgi:septum formation protein|nr:Maf family protein [Devosiaceae bacterium]
MLILASRSAARNALLAGAGLKFESRPARIDERQQSANAAAAGLDAVATAKALAEAKAEAVAAENPGRIVIGADQTLECEGRLLHKVADMAAAREQLRGLRGRTHYLHSGVALAREDGVMWSAVETAALRMRDFSNSELETTLALEGDAVLTSVGCYRLEGPSIRLFERIEGDYFTILGLPLLPLLSALRQYAPKLL